MQLVTRTIKNVSNHSGLKTLLSASLDVHILIIMRCVRLAAFGAISLILVRYLKNTGIDDTVIGVLLTMIVVGDLVLSFVLALVSDSLGRRKILIFSSLLMSATGVLLYFFPNNLYIVAPVLFLGIVTPSGGEVGPFRSVEQSAISSLCEREDRGDIFSWYTFSGTISSGVGSLLIGKFVTETDYGFCFGFYCAVGLLLMLLTLLLSENIEAHNDIDLRNNDNTPNEGSRLLNSHPTNAKLKKRLFLSGISEEAKPTLLILASLTALDALGSSLSSDSWTVYYFIQRFQLSSKELGVIFGTASFISGVSVLFSSYVNRKIGPLKTMLSTHVISQLLLIIQAMPIGLYELITVFLVKAFFRVMDQPSKHVFISVVVKPEERTAAIAFINATKTLMATIGPLITGYMSYKNHLWLTFLIAAGIRLSYDLGLLIKFVGKVKDT